MRWFTLFRSPASVASPNKGAAKLRLVLEQLEERTQPSVSGFRPVDETGNNIANPAQGTAGTDLLRVSPAAYADGISAPSLPSNPSARVVSDILNNQADPANPSEDVNTLNQNNFTDFGYVFGQFIDHDMDLTPGNGTELLSILADPNDPSQIGNQTFARSVYDPATGVTGPRQQINAVTSYLDLSQVYGSTAPIADALRTHTGGLMKTSPGNMLPYDNLTYFPADQLKLFGMANDSGMAPTESLFVTGDVRGNENVELTALQTLFVRNHNRIANVLHVAHPSWTDEQLYQEARKLNIAQYQWIIYNAYLPDLLGSGAMPSYAGYNPKVNPSIATEFSTVAFRFGHSLLDNDIERHDNSGRDITSDPAGADISLALDFFDPYMLNPNGVVDPYTGYTSTDIDPILKADADGVSQADDLLAVNAVRNLLFGNSGQTDNGLDLIARDIERARDHGIGSYNQVRKAFGLQLVTSFAQITSNAKVQQALQKAYGAVDNIDPFEGGMAEDHVRGSDLGPLFTRILVDQFNRLRAGDRFFYLNQTMTTEELSVISRGNTLGEIIEANTGITNLQNDVFVFRASISGSVLLDTVNRFTRTPSVLAGVTVNLLDEDGNVVGTTVTNSLGQYFFNQQSGLSGTGTYTVSIVLPAGVTLKSAPPPVAITRGDFSARGGNFIVHQGAWQQAVTATQTTTDWVFANTPV